MGSPFSLFNIELTNHCIMKCVMCPRTGHMTRSKGFMDPSLFRHAIDQLAAANPGFSDGSVLWLHHFGESLLHPQFAECIRYANRAGIRTGLSINPVMLTPRVRDDLLEARPSVLYVSLDGHDDRSFAEIRGMERAYEMSRDRLLGFLAAKTDRNIDTAVILSMIDFPGNRESIQKTRRYWESRPGINGVLLKSYTRWDGSVDRINRLAGTDSPVPDRSRVQCTVPWDTMTVTWDGDVVPCCFDYDKKYVLGSMLRSSLADIWSDGPIERLRAELLANDVRNPLCRACERLYMPKESIAW